MILSGGTYCYEIRRNGEIVAIEQESFDGSQIVGTRSSPDGSNFHEVQADVSDQGVIARLAVRYKRGPFARNGIYEAGQDFLEGSVSALAGRNAVMSKLGRFREIDADLVLFRALTIAHLRQRGQTRWTGRVATIDSTTLVPSSNKQSARATDSSGLRWIYEPRMGDFEEIELDQDGRILSKRDNRGTEVRLIV